MMKEENVLFYAEHENFGGWYFTNLGKLATAVCCNRTGVEFHLDKDSNWKGWRFKTIKDGKNVKYGYINPSNYDIMKAAFTQQK